MSFVHWRQLDLQAVPKFSWWQNVQGYMASHFGWPWAILTVFFIFVIMPSATNELCPLSAIRSSVSFTWILVALDDHGSDIWVHNSPPPWLMWRAEGVGLHCPHIQVSFTGQSKHWLSALCTVGAVGWWWPQGGVLGHTWCLSKNSTTALLEKKIRKKARNSRHLIICNRSA